MLSTLATNSFLNRIFERVEDGQGQWLSFQDWLATPAGAVFLFWMISAAIVAWIGLFVWITVRKGKGKPRHWRSFFRRKKGKPTMTRAQREQLEQETIEDAVYKAIDDLVYAGKITEERAQGVLKTIGKSGRLVGLLMRVAKRAKLPEFIVKTDIIERRGTGVKAFQQPDTIPFPDGKRIRKPRNPLEAGFGGISH